MNRTTTLVHSRLKRSQLLVEAAREQHHGLQILTFEHLATRLAGGFLRPVDDDSLRQAIAVVLPEIQLDELEKIKDLPGMVSATAATLRKVWRAGLDLQARAKDHRRLQSMAQLEKAVLAHLPSGLKTPTELVELSLGQLSHVKNLFGTIEIVGITELSPVWRPLLAAIARETTVRWLAGPRTVPAWLLDIREIETTTTPATKPSTELISASTPQHEAVEAMRWIRDLLASDKAKPHEIAIASNTTAEYDDFFYALKQDADFDLHFVHGISVLTNRDGQAAAALAAGLVHGLSRQSIERLYKSLAGYVGSPFEDFPSDWLRNLSSDIALTSLEAWQLAIDQFDEDMLGKDLVAKLLRILQLLTQGVDIAEQAGEDLLAGRAREIWKRALIAGPVEAVETTLTTLRQNDGMEPSVSACWMSANELAAAPRRFVRLLGLNSSHWPRTKHEDRLLADHIIPTTELDPLPVADADRRDFETILATTQSSVHLSLARRDEDGRLRGRSPLLGRALPEVYLRRNRVPAHAFSETDRLFARPSVFARTPQAKEANQCWLNWQKTKITPHDGLVRRNHPVVKAILERTQSATSFTRLLRNPLGFLWHYGLGLASLDVDAEPLEDIGPLEFGAIVHDALDRVVKRLEAQGGLVNASGQKKSGAIKAAVNQIASEWADTFALPPAMVWQAVLEEVKEAVKIGIDTDPQESGKFSSYGEVPFGGIAPRSKSITPWDTDAVVVIPKLGFLVNGYIDRIDVAKNQAWVSVCDYKTGSVPKNMNGDLDGGKELQRCLYTFAVKAMFGDDVKVNAELFYLLDGTRLELFDPTAAMKSLANYLKIAKKNLKAGNALMGIGTGQEYDDLVFALPANMQTGYRQRKEAAANDLLGDLPSLWEGA